MAYEPGPTAHNIEDLPRYVTQELRRISTEVGRLDNVLRDLIGALISAGIITLYIWDDSLIIADPGTGQMRGNGVQLPTVTEFAVSATTVTAAQPPFQLLDPGDFIVVVNESADVSEIYTLDTNPIFNTTWWQFNVTHVSGANNNPAAGAIMSFIWFPIAELPVL